MSTAVSINIKGESGDKVKLNEKVFGVVANENLLNQAVRVFRSNQRKANARTKSRGDVNKTTAKMYRQKGTGRARHGSYSAPVFVGGGIAFGPKGTQNYKLKLTKNQTREALLGALSIKASEQKVIVLGGVKKFSGKTKEAQKITDKTVDGKERLLVVAGQGEVEALRMFRNIGNVKVARVNQLNTYLVMASNKILMTEAAQEELNRLFTDGK
jgi:large subunit ribosomal protein L4